MTSNLSATHKHPASLWVLSLIFALFMWTFGGLIASLVIFLKQDLHIPTEHAYGLFGAYASLMWTLPLIGGFLAGKIGHKPATGVGLLFVLIGMLLLMVHNLFFTYLGLAAYVTGNAFFTPGLWCLIDFCYEKNDKRREAGFTLFYMCFNVGAILGIFIGGYLSSHVGFGAAFGLNAVLLIFSFVLYVFSIRHLQFDTSRLKELEPHRRGKLKLTKFTLACIIGTPLVTLLYWYPSVNRYLLYVLCIVSFIAVFKIAMKQIKPTARFKVLGFLSLSIIAIVFWSLYGLEPSLLSVYIEHNVVKQFLGMRIPTESFFGFEGVFIVLIGFFFSRLWVYLGNRNKDPSMAFKFALSMVLIGLGFVYLYAGVYWAGLGHQLPAAWIIFAYAFFAAGELLIGPLGISMVGRLSPHGQEGFFMGVWQLVLGLGSVIAGELAKLTVTPKASSLSTTNPIFAHLFLSVGVVSIIAGCIAVLLALKIRKWL
jgi:proton-dependent oligopeptide transporter, POT family